MSPLAYVLITILVSGHVGKVIEVADYESCVARAAFEIRFDVEVEDFYCEPSSRRQA